MSPVIVTVRVSERSGLLAEAREPGLPEPGLLACPVGEDTSPRAAGHGVAREAFARTHTAPFLHDLLRTRHCHSLGAGETRACSRPQRSPPCLGQWLRLGLCVLIFKNGAVGAPS